MKIRLWKGFHSESLRELLEKSWAADDLLILCPPFLKDLGFTRLLPEGSLEFSGEWEAAIHRECRATGAASYPARPVLGVFTTGTISGVPRLVLYSKDNVEASLASIMSVFERSQIARIFSYPQPFHTFGLVLGYLLSLRQNLPLVTGLGRYSASFHEAWTETSKDGLLSLGTPTHFYDLIQYVRDRGLKPEPSYSSIIGGAKVSVELWRDVRDTLCITKPSIGYGATEAAPGIAHHPPGLEPREDGEIGYPFPELHVSLQAGRGLEFTGRSLCLAIIQNGEIHFPSSLLITDDVRRRGDGMLVYHGRTELILNRGGQKFSLEYLEEWTRQKLGVEVVCVSLPHQRLGEDLGVLVRSTADQRHRVHEALCHAFECRFEVDNFIEIPELPLTENAKIDRKGSTALVLQHRQRSAP